MNGSAIFSIASLLMMVCYLALFVSDPLSKMSLIFLFLGGVNAISFATYYEWYRQGKKL